MSRKPQALSVVNRLQAQAIDLDNAARNMTANLSARAALAQFATERAVTAAVRAEEAAIAAQAGVVNAQNSANQALNAANNAQGAANNANNAAANAQGAANYANNRAAILEKTTVFIQNPVTQKPYAPLGGTFQFIPEMTLAGNFEGYPVIVFYSAEVTLRAGTWCDFLIYHNGTPHYFSYRRVSGDPTADGARRVVTVCYSLRTTTGSDQIGVAWLCNSEAYSDATRRQLTVLRIGTS